MSLECLHHKGLEPERRLSVTTSGDLQPRFSCPFTTHGGATTPATPCEGCRHCSHGAHRPRRRCYHGFTACRRASARHLGAGGGTSSRTTRTVSADIGRKEPGHSWKDRRARALQRHRHKSGHFRPGRCLRGPRGHRRSERIPGTGSKAGHEHPSRRTDPMQSGRHPLRALLQLFHRPLRRVSIRRVPWLRHPGHLSRYRDLRGLPDLRPGRRSHT